MIADVSTTVPNAFAGGTAAIAVLVLLTEFMMLRTALLRAQVRLYAAQSILVVALTAIIAVDRGVRELFILAGLSFGLKAVAVPVVILWLLRRSNSQIAGSGALGVSSAVLVSIVVAAFGFFVSNAFDLHSPVLPPATLSLAVAVVLLSFVLMIVRRDVVSQAVGLFSLENGISIASLVVAAGLPLILEIVLLFDLLVVAVAFGLIMRAHHLRTSSLSTETLDRLRG